MGQEALQQTSMSQCIPMLSMTGTFLSNQILPLKGKWEALRQRKLNISDLSLARDSDANNAKDTLDEELDMQGNKPNSTKQHQWPVQWSTCQQHEDKHGKPRSKTVEGDVAVEASSSEAGSSAPSSCNVSIQEDEMLSWLHYPVDENFEKAYCSELFGDVPNSGIQTFRDLVGNRRTPPATASNASLGTMQLSRLPPNAEDAMALGAERAAGLSSQVGLEAFCKVRTSIQPPVPKWPTTGPATAEPQDSPKLQTSLPSKCMAVNFPHFSVPVATASSNFHSVGAPCDAVDQSNAKTVLERGASFIGESVTASQSHEIETTPKSSLKKEPDSLMSAGGSSSCKTKSFEIDNYHRSASEGRKKHEPEPTLTSSSGGSENTTEKSEKGERLVLAAEKRKATEMTDSLECQSEEVEAEYSDLKKSSCRPKRSRAAEVHNLSERRRRDRINEKMRALQELIPNSNKTDKASMLDEAIEYLKMLQLQLQMMSMRSGMSIPPMVVPSGVQPLQMPQMPPLPYGMGMGMNIGMNMGMGMGMSMMDLGSNSSVRPMQPPTGSTGEVSDPLPQQCSNLVESYNLYLSQQQMQVPLQVVNMDMYNTYMLPVGPQLQQSQHHQQQQQQQQQQLQLHDQQVQVQQLNHQQQQSLLQHHSSLNNGFHQ